ncbi:hypothetical protein ACIQU6_44390 [Streptomyces sp. NPDC090442]|uniref:hypothetical protein n=1 Tax=Streptomyces sp. NPDC090442 TaxID=3365962 RepID=UPI00382C367F
MNHPLPLCPPQPPCAEAIMPTNNKPALATDQPHLDPVPVTLIPVDGDQEADMPLAGDVFTPLTIEVREGGLHPLEGVLVDFTLEGPTSATEPQYQHCPTNALGQAPSRAFAPLEGSGTYTLIAELHNTDAYQPSPSSLVYSRVAPAVLLVASVPKRCYLAGNCPLRLRVIRPATDTTELAVSCTSVSDAFQLSVTPQSPPAATADTVTDEGGNFTLFLCPVKPLPDPIPAAITLQVAAADGQTPWTVEIPCPQILIPVLIDISTAPDEDTPVPDTSLESTDGQALVPLTVRAMGPGPDDDPVPGQQLGEQPLPDIAVDFSVTSPGNETRPLGTRYTDAHGEATSPSSLGSYAGRGTYTLTAQLSPPTSATRDSTPDPATRTSTRTPSLQGPTAIAVREPFFTFAYTVKEVAEHQNVRVFETYQDPTDDTPLISRPTTGTSGIVALPNTFPPSAAGDYRACLMGKDTENKNIHLAEPLTFTLAASTLTASAETFPAGQDITLTYTGGTPNAVISIYTEMEGPPASGEQGPGALDTQDATASTGTVTFPADTFTSGTFITNRNFTAYMFDMGDGTSELDDYRWLSIPCHITILNTPWINNFSATWNTDGTISTTGRCGPLQASVEAFRGDQNEWAHIDDITDNTFTNDNIPASHKFNNTTLRLRIHVHGEEATTPHSDVTISDRESNGSPHD